MLIFKWDSQLETGIELLDQQHKNILNEANIFFISYKCGNPQAKLEQYLVFLGQYVLYHFQAEESFQSQCHYPGFLDHQAEHQTLKMQLKFHATSLTDSHFDKKQVDLFYQFMREWIAEHILSKDLAFATYYRAYMKQIPNQAG